MIKKALEKFDLIDSGTTQKAMLMDFDTYVTKVRLLAKTIGQFPLNIIQDFANRYMENARGKIDSLPSYKHYASSAVPVTTAATRLAGDNSGPISVLIQSRSKQSGQVCLSLRADNSSPTTQWGNK